MAHIHPLRALRYTSLAGPVESLATLPYDVIPAALETEYKARSEYNFAHLILPRGDYAGAAARLEAWKRAGALAADAEAAVFIYEQSFPAPDTGAEMTRRGFIALGDTEDYGQTVFRHEWTMSGPKEDRFRLLEATRVQFDSIFMLFPDESGAVDALLDEVTAGPAEVEYGDHEKTRHRLWRCASTEWIARLQAVMAPARLLIADGHHRYETALRMGQPKTLMTFVPLESKGLKCFATHRIVHSLEGFDPDGFLREISALGACRKIEKMDLASPEGCTRIVVALGQGLWAVDIPTEAGALNVAVLQERILTRILELTPEKVTAGGHLRYKRSIVEALDEVRSGRGQAGFLLADMPVADVARVSFDGRVLPQKSTFFYPKLGSGLVQYELE
jgi:uncharacterized protein (DUF1015 family)